MLFVVAMTGVAASHLRSPDNLGQWWGMRANEKVVHECFYTVAIVPSSQQ